MPETVISKRSMTATYRVRLDYRADPIADAPKHVRYGQQLTITEVEITYDYVFEHDVWGPARVTAYAAKIKKDGSRYLQSAHVWIPPNTDWLQELIAAHRPQWNPRDADLTAD